MDVNDESLMKCRHCDNSIFPKETAPWGTCAVDRRSICILSPGKDCINFKERKVKNGKDK